MELAKRTLKEHWYFVLQDLENEIIKYKQLMTGRVLDFGCGQKPYEQLFNASQYIGLEYDCEISRMGNKADAFYDGKTFPFEDNSFDNAISTQVLEHVPNPYECMNEVARVLKPGGYLMLSVPFLQEQHGAPYDFQRFTEFGIRTMFENTGFEIIEYKKLTCGVKALISTITFYIRCTKDRGNFKSRMRYRILNYIGLLWSKRQKKDGGLYINNFIIARKK